LNWRTVEQKSSYPSYKALIVEFEKAVEQLNGFCQQIDIATPQINQWEITYVDRFPKGELWRTPSDWGSFLPGLFASGDVPAIEGLRMDSRSLQWAFEIEPALGRLHIETAVSRGPTPDEEALIVTLTARGPLHPKSTPTYRHGLDLGHEVSVNQFLKFVDNDIRNSWGERSEP